MKNQEGKMTLVTLMLGQLVLPTHPIQLDPNGRISVQRDTERYLSCPDADRALRQYLIDHFSTSAYSIITKADVEILAHLIIHDFVESKETNRATAGEFADFVKTTAEPQKETLLCRVEHEKTQMQQAAASENRAKTWKNRLLVGGMALATATSLALRGCKQTDSDTTPPPPHQR